MFMVRAIIPNVKIDQQFQYHIAFIDKGATFLFVSDDYPAAFQIFLCCPYTH